MALDHYRFICTMLLNLDGDYFAQLHSYRKMRNWWGLGAVSGMRIWMKNVFCQLTLLTLANSKLTCYLPNKKLTCEFPELISLDQTSLAVFKDSLLLCLENEFLSGYRFANRTVNYLSCCTMQSELKMELKLFLFSVQIKIASYEFKLLQLMFLSRGLHTNSHVYLWIYLIDSITRFSA